jgi:dynactin complex subunit
MAKKFESFNIDGVKVEISCQGDEELSLAVYLELKSKCEEIRQIIEDDIPPSKTQRKINVDWELVSDRDSS